MQPNTSFSHLLKQLQITPADPKYQKRLLEFTSASKEELPLGVLRIFLGAASYSFEDILDLAEAIINRYGMGFNDVELDYIQREELPKELQVLIHAAWEERKINLPDFEELMLRYFQAAQTRAELYHDPILQDERWPKFLQNLQTLQSRVQVQSPEST